MNTVSHKTIYLKYISHKTIKDANGNEKVERVFTLTPVKKKEKKILTKDEVLAMKKEKKEKPYISLGISNKIPKAPVEKDENGKIIPMKDMWSDIGKTILKQYREAKEKLDAETTEIITLPNGFKKKIKIKLDFKPLPSMTLSSEERKTRMEEHKQKSKANRTIRNARVLAFNKNAKSYTPEPYVSNTKARKEKQAKYWDNHNKIINELIQKLRMRGKKRSYHLIPSITSDTKDNNGVYKSIPLFDKQIIVDTTSKDVVGKAKEVLQAHKEYSGIQIHGDKKDMYLSRLSIAA